MEESGQEVHERFIFKQITPYDVGKVKDLIRYTVVRTAPPYMARVPESTRNLLLQLIAGAGQAWVLYTEGADKQKLVYLIMITSVQKDRLSGSKYLHIYSMFAFRKLSDAMWAQVRASIVQYARGVGCTVVTALTSNEAAISRALKLGGTQMSFLFTEV